MTTEIAKNWNNLDRADKLEIIEQGIDFGNTSEGFLMMRFWKKDKSISVHISNSLENHLCVEAVSQSTLSELFSDDHDLEEEDAEVILNWMEAQN